MRGSGRALFYRGLDIVAKGKKGSRVPWSDGKLLTVSVILTVFVMPVGVVMLIYYARRKKKRPLPPVVPWAAWGESVHQNSAQVDRMRRATAQDIRFKSYSKDGVATVRGSSGETYYTTFGGCTCQDFVKRGKPCKHMYALAIQKAGFDPAPYLWFRD